MQVVTALVTVQLIASTNTTGGGYFRPNDYNASTNALSFELTPTVTMTLDKLSILVGADSTFTALPPTAGSLYSTVTYSAGWATAYVTPRIYLTGVFAIDTAITFNIPHAPILLEYTASDVTKAGTITADVTISF